MGGDARLGEQGYLEIAERIFETAATILTGVAAIPELEIFGDPTFIIAFRGRGIDIYHVNDFLIEGVAAQRAATPARVALLRQRPNTADGIAEAFLADLRDAVEYAKTPGLGPARSGALYGLGGSPEGNEALDMLFAAALDAMYDVVPEGMAEPWILAVDLGTGGPKRARSHCQESCSPLRTERSRPRSVTMGAPSRTRVPGGTVSARVSRKSSPTAWMRRRRRGRDHRPVGINGAGRGRRRGCRTMPALVGHTRTNARRETSWGRVNVVGYSPFNLFRWLRLTGGAPSPGGADPLGHHLHLAMREPEVYARVETLLEPLDYLGMRFTGRRAATQASMILSWLTDNRPRGKGGYQPGLLRRSGREPAKLPKLLPTGSVLGGLLSTVASELGLPEGIPVVAGIPDLHTGYIGSGAVAPYAGHLTISTSAWIGCEVPFKRTDVFHQVASVPGLRAGSYLVANNHETAGALPPVAARLVGSSETTDLDGSAGYKRLTALASTPRRDPWRALHTLAQR